MKRIHFVFGLVLVLVFLLTGQYMEYVHNRTLPDGVRVLYRSRHIYLLLNALINIALGLYVQYAPSGWRRSLEIIGSVLIIVAPAFLLAGFFMNRLEELITPSLLHMASSRRQLGFCYIL